MELFAKILTVIANTKKYLQSDWLRGVEYWPYLYSVFNIFTVLLNNDKKINIPLLERKNRIAFIENKLAVIY